MSLDQNARQRDRPLDIRPAETPDLLQIVRLLADDFLGQRREVFTDPLPASYIAAFESIQSDPNNEILVVVLEKEIVATLQLTYTPSLSYRGQRSRASGRRRTCAARVSGESWYRMPSSALGHAAADSFS